MKSLKEQLIEIQKLFVKKKQIIILRRKEHLKENVATKIELVTCSICNAKVKSENLEKHTKKFTKTILAIHQERKREKVVRSRGE